MTAYIPEPIDLSAERHSDKYHYMLSSITHQSVFDKSIKKNDFVRISSKIWHDTINSRYRKRIDELINYGIIETDSKYFVGEFSKGYRFTSPYREKKLKRIVIDDKKIIRRYSEHRKIYLENNIQLPEHKYLYNCLNHTEFLQDEALHFVKTQQFDDLKTSIYNMMIDYLASKNWHWKIDGNGRLHNNITNLPKSLRKFLRSPKNSPLFEVDISNSQPLLFNILIKEYMRGISSGDSSIYIPSYVTTFPDIELYRELTEQGIFYDNLMEKFVRGIESNDYLLDDLSVTEPREAFKITFFKKVFYSKDNPSRPTNEREQFKHLFPTVSEIVAFYKKDNYKNLANRLQQVEAELIINRVVPQLAERNIFCLTIHDSILTTPENIDVVKQIITSEFQAHYGLTPKLKSK